MSDPTPCEPLFTTVQVTITYDSPVASDTVRALVDEIATQEGVGFVAAMRVEPPYARFGTEAEKELGDDDGP